jgi:hypothetical protein
LNWMSSVQCILGLCLFAPGMVFALNPNVWWFLANSGFCGSGCSCSHVLVCVCVSLSLTLSLSLSHYTCPEDAFMRGDHLKYPWMRSVWTVHFRACLFAPCIVLIRISQSSFFWANSACCCRVFRAPQSQVRRKCWWTRVGLELFLCLLGIPTWFFLWIPTWFFLALNYQHYWQCKWSMSIHQSQNWRQSVFHLNVINSPHTTKFLQSSTTYILSPRPTSSIVRN